MANEITAERQPRGPRGSGESFGGPSKLGFDDVIITGHRETRTSHRAPGKRGTGTGRQGNVDKAPDSRGVMYIFMFRMRKSTRYKSERAAHYTSDYWVGQQLTGITSERGVSVC